MRVQREGRQALEGLSRLGIAARGLVWLVLSALAAQIALGRGGEQADQDGALRALRETPLGAVLLAVLALGFLGYALALVLQAVESRGSTSGAADRAKAAGKAALYLLLAASAGRFALGGGGSGGGGSGGSGDPRPLTARLLEQPFGRWLVALVGLAVVGVGLYLALRGVRREHEERIRTWQLHAGTESAVRRVGVLGHLGRALVVLLVGGFVCLAALRADPREARGLDAALRALAGEPYGPLVLAAVVLGALAYALWSFAEAALRRPGSR